MTEENSEIKFYQARNSKVQTLGQQKDKNNSILFSVDKLNMYGNFNDNFNFFGEKYYITDQKEYNQLLTNEQIDNKKIYCIIDGKITSDTERNYPIHIGINKNNFIITTNKEL